MNFDARIREDYDTSAHKLLSDQRDAYIAQSARTRDGALADFNAAEAYARDAMQDAQDDMEDWHK